MWLGPCDSGFGVKFLFDLGVVYLLLLLFIYTQYTIPVDFHKWFIIIILNIIILNEILCSAQWVYDT